MGNIRTQPSGSPWPFAASARAWQLFDIINPVNHSLSSEGAAIYRVEPYVMAADLYAVAPHTGHGGWTWYTGSAGWMYKLIIESLLGLRLEIDELRFAPCFPAERTGFKVHYRFREMVYHITVLQSPNHEGEMNVIMDGVPLDGKKIRLVDDLQEHFVELTLAPTKSPILT